MFAISLADEAQHRLRSAPPRFKVQLVLRLRHREGEEMFSHVMIGADDVDASKRFYDAALGALGVPPGRKDDKGRVFYRSASGVFALTKPINSQPASCGNGSTIGFAAASPEQADAWHQAGLEHGGTAIEDPPGIREGAIGKLYLAYLRDPAGNKVCALHRIVD